MPQSIHAIIQESSDWLVGEQDDSGGWGERKSSYTNALNTAEVILALLQTNPLPVESIRKGTDFLLAHQHDGDEESGAWMRQVHRDQEVIEVPDIIRTCFAIQALSRARFDPKGTEAVARGIQWLLGRRLPDGGWGFSRGSSSAYMPTALTLLTLITSCGKEAGDELFGSIQKGFEFLLDNFHNTDGSFGRAPELVVPHTIYGVLLLKAAMCRRDLGKHLNPQDLASLLDNAKAWLIKNAAKAKQINEETFRIDKEKGIGNYRFRYMTDALLVQAFEDTDASEVIAIAEAISANLDDRKAPGGGFYGDRVSTWATAKVLSGLHVIKSLKLEPIPIPPPPPPSPVVPDPTREWRWQRVVQAVSFAFVAIMIPVTVYLKVNDKLDFMSTTFFGFLLLVVLLLAGRIDGPGFQVILKDFWEAIRPHRPNVGGKTS